MEYCPTDCMLGDFFTKPLQGKLFHDMRDVIMGHQNSNILNLYFKQSKSVALDRKERVAENKINEGAKLEKNKKWRKINDEKNIAVRNISDRHYTDVESNVKNKNRSNKKNEQ